LVHFLLGTAGTGKTTRLIGQIKKLVSNGGKAILLIPEQYSFAAERMLQASLGPQAALEVEVLSFTRMCTAIFRKLGGLAGVPVSQAGKYMLMSVALGELRDTLQIYRKSAANPSFLETLVAACTEFSTAGILPDRLEAIAQSCAPSPLKDKLTELGTIYSAYHGLLDRGYTNPDDDLIRAEKLLGTDNFFGGISVFVDGFTTFMAAEFALLNRMIVQADDITFAMTADMLQDEQKGTGVFSPAKAAVNRIIRYARQSGVPVATPEVLETPLRYTSGALAHLSRYFLQPSAVAFEGDAGEAVQLLEAGNIYTELEAVAASIAVLVREEGYRYNRIAVVTRDPAPYSRAIQTMFARYEIPWFMDDREEVESFPLIGGLLSALDAVRSGFDSETVLAFAKSPLGGFDGEAVAALENYCYCWGVRGAVWTMPFANNPRGLAEGLSVEDRAALAALNQVREAVITPLQELREALKNATGIRFATGIFTFLERLGAAENLTAYAESMPQGEREAFLDKSAQLWDILMEILDVFGSVLGGVSLQTPRACELFRLSVGTAEVAQVPQTLDQVLVGGADRIRLEQIQAVFVIGAQEGFFPRQVTGGGLFTDAERLQMLELGAELSPPTLQQSVLERFYAYFALTIPSRRLHVSYARRDSLGREQQPSVIVSQLKTLFPGLVSREISPETLLASEKAAFGLLARGYRQDTALTSTLLAHFQGGPADSALSRIHRAVVRPEHAIADASVPKALFGTSMRLSPSRVERYYRCPFSYFASDGLSLRKRRRVEFTPLESGGVIHNVLQVMVQRHGGKGLAALSQQQLKDETARIITEYLSQRVENMDALPSRFRYLFGRLTGMLARLLAHLGAEFMQSDFIPTAFELPIRQGEGVAPLRLETVDGVTVSVEGVVDRVDIMEKGGKRYVRVVDYKSGGKEFRLGDILYGLNMQMLLYLFTISENGTGPLADAIPAGVLYMPVAERYVTAGRDTSAASVVKERERQWRMNGFLLEDEEVLRGMERDIAGVFIPAKLTKTGELDAKSSLASRAEMGRLAEKVRGIILQMAEELGKGKIPALPVDGGDYDTCAYCDFRKVCGFEAGDAIKSIAKIDRAEFFKRLEEEQNAQLD